MKYIALVFIHGIPPVRVEVEANSEKEASMMAQHIYRFDDIYRIEVSHGEPII